MTCCALTGSGRQGRIGRPGMADAEADALGTRVSAGESCPAIGRALGTPVGSIDGRVRLRGGIKPPVRRRAVQALTRHEREGISRGRAAGPSVRSLARALARAPATSSRERIRHGGSDQSRALDADGRAWHHAKRPTRCRVALPARRRGIDPTTLRAHWSPAPIAGGLVSESPEAPEMRVSHETSDRSLCVQPRGALTRERTAPLRPRRPRRRRTRATKAGQTRYAAGNYQVLLAAHDMECSMSGVGDCWDNAVAESFFATLKRELADGADWQTRDEARTAVFAYIEMWYNRQRRHSSLRYLSPLDYEQQLASKQRLNKAA